LSVTEQARYARLKIEKRRRDWLLGRWTAKHLLQTYLSQPSHEVVPLDALVVESRADGVPFAVWCRGAESQLLTVQLSISHSQAHAFCALAPQSSHACTSLGADIEKVEPRSSAFVADFFTPDEADSVWRASDQQRALLVTLIWSAKEAALKALHKGLSADTRRISVVCDLTDRTTCAWAPLRFDLDPGAFGESTASGWWRVAGEFVLTLAVVPGVPLLVSDTPISACNRRLSPLR
jgi:4'-phosphopantetheinyl transferase